MKLSIKTGKFSKMFSSDESRFRISVGLNVLFIFVFNSIIALLLLQELLDINYLFFSFFSSFSPKASAASLSENFRSIYFANLFSDLWDFAPYFLGFLVTIFFWGYAISGELIRPFSQLADYCFMALEEKGRLGKLSPSLFRLNLLNHICGLFFSSLKDARRKGSLSPVEIPDYIAEVHRPLNEWGFYLSLVFMFAVIIGVTSFFSYFAMTEIFENLINFSLEQSGKKAELLRFLGHLKKSFERLLFLNAILLLISYSAYAWYLKNQILNISFAVFSTFRRYLKGDYGAKIHIVGHNYIRFYTRQINRFLHEFPLLADRSQK